MQLGKLVQFEKRRAPRTKQAPASGGRGEVVLFTGVRYERTAAPATLPDKGPAAAGGKRKRV